MALTSVKQCWTHCKRRRTTLVSLGTWSWTFQVILLLLTCPPFWILPLLFFDLDLCQRLQPWYMPWGGQIEKKNCKRNWLNLNFYMYNTSNLKFDFYMSELILLLEYLFNLNFELELELWTLNFKSNHHICTGACVLKKLSLVCKKLTLTTTFYALS